MDNSCLCGYIIFGLELCVLLEELGWFGRVFYLGAEVLGWQLLFVCPKELELGSGSNSFVCIRKPQTSETFGQGAIVTQFEKLCLLGFPHSPICLFKGFWKE